MSFNNWLDLDAAAGLAADLGASAGVTAGASADAAGRVSRRGRLRDRQAQQPLRSGDRADAGEAYRRAFASDEVSRSAASLRSRGVDRRRRRAMEEVFTEVVVAPAYTDEGRDRFGRRENLRVVRAPLLTRPDLDVRRYQRRAREARTASWRDARR